MTRLEGLSHKSDETRGKEDGEMVEVENGSRNPRRVYSIITHCNGED